MKVQQQGQQAGHSPQPDTSSRVASESWMLVVQVGMDSVLEVRSGLVVLKRGAERSVVLVSSGILGYALDKAKVGAPETTALRLVLQGHVRS